MHCRKPSLCLAMALVLILCARGARSGEPEETERAASKAGVFGPDFSDGLLERRAVLEAAEEVTAERHPNADDVLVDDHIRVQYNADGTSVTWDDWYVKILTEKGRKKRALLSLYFTQPYSLPEDVQVRCLELIKPDGTVQAVDVARQSRITINRSQMAANIYNPKSKILQVTVPNLEVGDVVHYITYKRVRHPRVKNVWADLQIFEYTSPIQHYIYEVLAPPDRPLKRIELKDEVAGTVVHASGEKDGVLTYRWEVQNVPRMFREPRMPSLSRVVQRLLISTAPDWKTISKWYWAISEPHYEVTPALRAKVKALTEGGESSQQKLEALFTFVSQRVRYLGITKEDTAPGYEPHDVADTFENLAGVCRDKAALLVAMLREAGFQAYPVLIHTGDKKDPDVPLPWFNHAIACVENEDGTYVLMDPTDESTKQLLPAYLNDKSYLVAKPEGETLKTSPIVPARENLMRIHTRGRIDAAGDLQAESVLHFDGQNDNGYRGWFARIKPSERRRYFEAVVKRVVPGARLTRFALTPQDMQDTSAPLRVELGFAASKVLVAGDDTRMLLVPGFGTRVGYASFILQGTGLEKREYPLKTDIACGVEEQITLELDPAVGAIASLPNDPPIESETLTWKRALLHKQGTLTGRSTFLLKVVEFSPAQYLALKKTLRTIEYNGRKMPILKAEGDAVPPRRQGLIGPGVDAVILEADIAYALEDERNWTETRSVKKKILTYAGKKRYADLRVGYNEAWETVELVRAVVRAPDGSVKEVAEEEVNRMDAGWVGAAPRYPASKTLVVSLPAVDVGSVIETTIVKTHKDKPFFAARESFRAFEPIVKKTVRVRGPRGLDLQVLKTGNDPVGSRIARSGPLRPIAERRERDDEGAVFTWTATNVKPVKRERRLPPWYGFAPTVFVSTGDWRGYADTAIRALRRAAARQSAATAKARALAADLEGEGERVRAVRDFLVRSIRLAGPALDEVPFSAVTPADKTLAEGYGSSADRAVLFYAMLRALRLRPAFVLASRASRVEALQRPLREVPDPGWFGEVLVQVRAGEADVILNDTDQYAALGATPHHGRPALVAGGAIISIQAPEALRDRSEVAYRVRLEPSGDAVIEREKRFYGTAYGRRRKFFAELPPEERRRAYQKMVAEVSQSAEPVGDLVTAFDAYPGREAFRVRWNRFAVQDGDYLYFRLPDSFADLFRFMSDTRENPLYQDDPQRHEIRMHIELPAEFAPTKLLPPPVIWDGPVGRVTVKHIEEEASDDAAGASPLALTLSAEFAPAVIQADRYEELLEIMRELSHPQARTVLLARPPSDRPAPAEEAGGGEAEEREDATVIAPADADD